jgi:hypothetical protein
MPGQRWIIKDRLYDDREAIDTPALPSDSLFRSITCRHQCEYHSRYNDHHDKTKGPGTFIHRPVCHILAKDQLIEASAPKRLSPR